MLFILKILLFVIKWMAIIFIPLTLFFIYLGLLKHYKKHKQGNSQKAYMTFQEFIKLYPVSSDRWSLKRTQESNLNGTRVFDKDEIFTLYFRIKDHNCWQDRSYCYIQIVFKTFKDFINYFVWIIKRNDMIKNNKHIQQQKADYEAMDKVLKIIQGDIDKAKAEANKQIEDSANATIEIVKRLEANEKANL